jgi:hypothetical protein
MPDLDIQQAHRHFSGHCFNQAWTLIDQDWLTEEETERLLHLAHSSFWHWSQRPDHDDSKRSIGYWQLSRVYVLAGQADNACRYARRCEQLGRTAGPFYLGYAYEALARATQLAGNKNKSAQHLHQARQQALKVEDDEERAMLNKDLDDLEQSS